MIAINQQRSKVCGILESSEAETRKSLLEEGDMSSPKLNYLLRLVDLLATCAEVSTNRNKLLLLLLLLLLLFRVRIVLLNPCVKIFSAFLSYLR